jgi:acyl-CoA reductase-like NAD-dependent aldehyde dehydrogenase
MELGGKGPAIVLDDTDLPAAAKKCILGSQLSTVIWYHLCYPC